MLRARFRPDGKHMKITHWRNSNLSGALNILKIIIIFLATCSCWRVRGCHDNGSVYRGMFRLNQCSTETGDQSVRVFKTTGSGLTKSAVEYKKTTHTFYMN